jgi:folylpolyglutamate synthase/dihydropteroate synthase
MQDEARRVADGATPEHVARDLLRNVAIAYARAGEPVKALGVLREKDLDGYLTAVATVQTHSPSTSNDVARAALAASVGVAAWDRPDWGEIARCMDVRG